MAVSIKENPLIYSHIDQACRAPSKALYPRSDEPVDGAGFADYLYTLLTREHGELSVFVKAYAKRQHGSPPLEKVGTVSSLRLFQELLVFTHRASSELGEPCTPSISGTFMTEDGQKFVVPMMDLEIPASGESKIEIEHDLAPLVSVLEKNGISGSILRSGDVGSGSYHFAGDFAVPYVPFFWQTIGWFMKIMVDNQEPGQNVPECQRLGRLLSSTQSLAEARQIAREVLDVFPSISSEQTRDGLFCDPRWGAHRIIQGFNTLVRVTPAKDYQSPPKHAADILPARL